MPVNALGGAFFIGPQQQARPTGAEAAPIEARGGVQPAAGDAVRPIEPGGEARGGLVDRRAEENRRGSTAFEELRRTLAGEDDPVALSAAGRRKSQETSADVFARAFGASGGQGEGEATAENRPDRAPRSFGDLFARPRAGAPPRGETTAAPAGPGIEGARPGEDAVEQGSFPPGSVPQAPESGQNVPQTGPNEAVIPPDGGNRLIQGVEAAEGAEAAEGGEAAEGADGAEAATGEDEPEAADGTNRRSANGDELTPEELEQVRQLEVRDAEVRAHEQAHKSVGGRYTGAISYDYQTGPDGRRYAVGGEVPIDISEIPGDPQATIQKMEIVRRAALAPAEPSGADRSVAAAAGQKAAQARVELTELRAEEIAEAREEAAEGAEEVTASGEDAAEVDGAEAADVPAPPAAPGRAEGPPPAGAQAPRPADDAAEQGAGRPERAAPPTGSRPPQPGAGFFIGRARPGASSRDTTASAAPAREAPAAGPPLLPGPPPVDGSAAPTPRPADRPPPSADGVVPPGPSPVDAFAPLPESPPADDAVAADRGAGDARDGAQAPAVDGSRIRRITPADGGGVFVNRRDDAEPGAGSDSAPAGPRVAALRATTG